MFLVGRFSQENSKMRLTKIFLIVLTMLFGGIMAAPNPASAETLTFRIRSEHENTVDVEFYSQERRISWPGNGQVYSIRDSETHRYALNCRRGEQICYGAWVRGERSTYWGVGYANQHRCKNCCYECDGETTRVIELEE